VFRSIFFALLVVVSFTQPTFSAQTSPNVVIIFADDMGFSDLGCYGGEIQTPNLDRLAKGGLRFSQFYNTGRCWPSRASLMTGLYPHQSGKAMSFGEKAPRGYSGIIPQHFRMVPEVLAAAGYRSYHVGKWHLNKRGGKPLNETWPLARGYQHSYFVVSQNNFFNPYLLYDDTTKITRPGANGDYYITEAFTAKAVDYLKEHQTKSPDKPFFLYLAHTAPHFPLHALASDVARYRGKYREGWDVHRRRRYERLKKMGIVNCKFSPRDPDAKPWDSLSDEEQDEWDSRMATYAAMIHCLDRGVGDVLAQIEAMNATENTLVMFLSDNGSSAEYLVRGDGHREGAEPGAFDSYRCLEVGWSNASNSPFRFHKMWMHEGGIATPLICNWPGVIKQSGAITDQVGHIIDLFPTIMDAAGVKYPKMYDGKKTPILPGKSLLPIFKGKERAGHEFLFWEHVGNKALRQGDWKLVAEHQGDWELYNLKTDRSELENLADQKPKKLKSLVSTWQTYADSIGVVDWSSLPQSKSKPSADYRRK